MPSSMSKGTNYAVGRRFEYERMKAYRLLGATVLRTAGSHGPFDIIAIYPNGYAHFIQCKVVDSEAAAKRLIEEFKTSPPFCGANFTQVMEVKIKGTSTVLSWSC